jgi:hypothetical protein
MAENLTNGFQTTLDGALDSSQTTATLLSATGAPSAPFRMLISAEGSNTDEIIYVGARSGTSLSNIIRAAEPIADGTQTASAHASGATITQVLTKGGLQSLGLATTPVGARVYKAAVQSIPNGVTTTLTFDSERFDTDGFHSTSSNTERLTIPAGMGGLYMMGGYINFASDNDGVRFSYIAVTGTAASQVAFNSSESVQGDVTRHTPVGMAQLSAGDYVEFKAYHTAGANLDVSAEFWVAKLDAGRVGSGVGARAYKTSGQSITSGSLQALTFDLERYDTDGFHDTSSNTSRFTIPSGMGGKYLIGGTAALSSSNATARTLAIRINGSTYIAATNGDPQTAVGEQYANVSAVWDMAAGDYAEIMYRQDSGGSLSLVAGSAYASEGWIARLDSNASGILASASVTRAGGSPYTTTSTSMTDVHASDFDLTITTGARKCLVGFTGGIYGSTNLYCEMDVTVDGTSIGDASTGLLIDQIEDSSVSRSASFTAMTSVLSAGSHTFTLRWKTSGGTLNMYAASGGGPSAHFWVQELPDSGALVSNTTAPGSTILFHQVPTGATITFTDTSYQDLDATNCAVTFTAPTSGRVIIRCNAAFHGSAAVDAAWALRDGSTVMAEAYTPTITSIQVTHKDFYVTGLTPGASYTLKWSAKSASGSLSFYRATTSSYAGGPMTMEVVVAP